jgi:hypothetical protein
MYGAYCEQEAMANTVSTAAPGPQSRRASYRERREREHRAARQRRLVLLAGGAIVLVLAVLIAARLLMTSQPTATNSPVPPNVMAALTGVPTAIFEQVGKGTAQAMPTPVRGDVRRGANGLPQVTYIGAEYCPFCAAERWPLVIALSRFGQFSGLQVSHSAGDDVYPNTPTFSFSGSTYTSPYLDFDSVELQSNVRSGGSYAPLQTPTADQQQLLRQSDGPPYVPASSAGAIPFADFANQYLISGASYDAGALRGQTVDSIAQNLSDPSAPTTQAIIGSANVITAALCQVTGDQPADVCGQPVIQALEATLAATPPPAT